MADVQHDSDKILHQDSVEEVVTETVTDMLDGSGAANVAIDDLVAITGGESPTEAEYNLVVTTVNAIIAALVNSGILPAAE